MLQVYKRHLSLLLCGRLTENQVFSWYPDIVKIYLKVSMRSVCGEIKSKDSSLSLPPPSPPSPLTSLPPP